MKKNLLAAIMAITMATTSLTAGGLMPAFASTSTKSASFDDIEFENFKGSYGYISVDLKRGEFTDESKVTVTDSKGKSYKATLIIEQDYDDDDDEKDEAVIKVSGLSKGKIYKFTITKIATPGSSKLQSLSGSFKASPGYETKYGKNGVSYVYD